MEQRVRRRSRTVYSARYKLRVVSEALARPPSCRIKPTCRNHPGIEPTQLRKWIKKHKSIATFAGMEERQVWLNRSYEECELEAFRSDPLGTAPLFALQAGSEAQQLQRACAPQPAAPFGSISSSHPRCPTPSSLLPMDAVVQAAAMEDILPSFTPALISEYIRVLDLVGDMLHPAPVPAAAFSPSFSRVASEEFI
mmetsp:Transcript_30933/g.91907  ORF Transcript_30933/g.91907 Transcript_30933/m.91907 type:complete len:196 (+) Transcript_30933:39-626(+)